MISDFITDLTDIIEAIGFAKYNENHDEHGRFATGGGNDKSHRQAVKTITSSDPSKQNVYAGEKALGSALREGNDVPAPTAPARADFSNFAEYKTAYDQYAKDWNNWEKERNTIILSPLGEKYLDGSKTGAQLYVGKITSSDWFKQAYGENPTIRTPELKASKAQSFAGRYEVGIKDFKPFSTIKINTAYLSSEPTILHEIAHYADTISAKDTYEGHGLGFANANVYISSKVVGSDYANQLHSAYKMFGANVGD